MRGQITLNGWSHFRGVRLRPGLISNSYRNQEGWFAQEVFRGPKNILVGLQVLDEKNQFVGMVKSVEELP